MNTKSLFKIKLFLYVLICIGFIANITVQIKHIDRYVFLADIVLFGGLIFIDIYEKNNKK